MLGVPKLLVEEGISLSSCTTTLDTLNFGEDRSPCDGEDDRRGG